MRYGVANQTLIFLAALLWSGSTLAADENRPGGFLSGSTKAQIHPAYQKALEENGSLALGNVDIVTLEDKSCSLVVVGTKTNQALVNPTPQAYLKNRNLARLEAMSAFARFLGSTVSTEQRLEKTVTTETVTKEDGSQERSRRVVKALHGLTLEQAEAKLRGAELVGTWFTENEQFFHLALAFPANCPDA